MKRSNFVKAFSAVILTAVILTGCASNNVDPNTPPKAKNFKAFINVPEITTEKLGKIQIKELKYNGDPIQYGGYTYKPADMYNDDMVWLNIKFIIEDKQTWNPMNVKLISGDKTIDPSLVFATHNPFVFDFKTSKELLNGKDLNLKQKGDWRVNIIYICPNTMLFDKIIFEGQEIPVTNVNRKEWKQFQEELKQKNSQK